MPPTQLERSTSSASASHGNSLEDNTLSILHGITMTRHIPCMCIQLWWNWTHNANRSFPLKIETGTEQTRSQTWGDMEPHLPEVLTLNTCLRPDSSLTSSTVHILPIWRHDCFLHYHRCVIRALIKTTISKWLETIHPIDSSLRSMMVIAEL